VRGERRFRSIVPRSLGLVLLGLLTATCGCLGTRGGASPPADPAMLSESTVDALPPFSNRSTTPPLLPGDLSELGHSSGCT
jgi:hypothetical protein